MVSLKVAGIALTKTVSSSHESLVSLIKHQQRRLVRIFSIFFVLLQVITPVRMMRAMKSGIKITRYDIKRDQKSLP